MAVSKDEILDGLKKLGLDASKVKYVVLSHALGLARITHFVPHYCSITRLNGDSLDDLSVVSVNETTFLRS